MYGFLWRKLPGPTALKLIEALVLLALVVALLFGWVFPWLVPLLPFNDVTVGEPQALAFHACDPIVNHGLVTVSILVVDNYDSFVYNLVQYLQQLRADVTVLRNDEARIDDAARYDGILLSPGPGTPEDAGVCMDMVGTAAATGTPLLGVCLGHQAIAAWFGGVVSRAPELLHGKTSQVTHDGAGVFRDVPNPFRATRYHSLALEPGTTPDSLMVTATSESGVIMGLRHRTLPIEGVQFHPESVLTQSGHLMLANWLASCGDDQAVAASQGLDPVTGSGAIPR